MKKKMIPIGAICILGIILTGCTTNKANLESNSKQGSGISTSNNQSIEENNASSSSNSKAVTNATSSSEDFAISLADAITIYQKQYPDTDITSIDINDKFGTYFYEITGVDDNTEYEVDVNVTNGEFRLDREEALDNDEKEGVKRSQSKINFDNLLPLSEINTIALKEADGTIKEWSLEKELSTTYWEVTVSKDHQEINVSIDAQSGNVLETEVDD
ncbi:PepSY domain-containing protein [Candidatus Enterococcus ferrettii]|uniref:PepSY domain-containing protein n=1 Tax=Candidatus Enterococcus ferrettii TaxID=2815324 RepID=A0ABV0ER26_9ENTE|nr:PepSY domain-containing protein [Enterococcus sp. 665A]MBO1340801.1 PepSY domain-containing protein [Enterococcus sp. 665A]